MNRKEFKNELVKTLESKGVEVDAKRIESAMNKTAIHARNKYGDANWDYEYEESGVGNAVYFYNEYKVENSFNRNLYRQNKY
jgi:hypothetical protein